MSNRKRNMLEAFQASAQEAEGEHVPNPSGGAGGPFAEEVRKEAEPTLPRREAAPVSSEIPDAKELLARLPLGPIAGVQLVLLALVFWLGYLSGSTTSVEAADTGPKGGTALEREVDPVTPTPGRNETAPQVDPTPIPASGTPYDAAFYALVQNGVTLRVAAYDLNPTNEQLAWDTYDYLIAQDLPAVTPVKKTESIFIFVGAAASGSELGAMKLRLSKLEDARGKRPFRDAYLVNIKDYIQR